MKREFRRVVDQTGVRYLKLGLAPAENDPFERQFDDASYLCHTSCHGWAIQLLREYAAANFHND